MMDMHFSTQQHPPALTPASMPMPSIKARAHEHLLQRIEILGEQFSRWDATQIRNFVEHELNEFVRLNHVPINHSEAQHTADLLLKEIAGLGPLEDLMNDPGVEDILVNGYDKLFVSRSGVLREERADFSDNDHLLRIVRRLLAPIGRRLDESSPMVDARLPGGSRLNAIIPPLSLDGPIVSIRKFRGDPFTIHSLVKLGAMDEGMAQLLELVVRERCNLLISGGTSSGKTSLLNAMAFFVPPGERVVTIEDTAELSLQHPHVVRLESRPGGFDGAGVISIRELLKNTLRMRPDRIIVGEVRGAEVIEMLQAMNTGHDGSMATLHASSPRDCLYRLEMLAGFAGFQGSEMSLRRQIASALDFIVQIGRLPNGRRRVLSITEVTGLSDSIISTQELYRHVQTVKTDGEDAEHWETLGVSPHSPKLARYRAILQPKIYTGR